MSLPVGPDVAAMVVRAYSESGSIRAAAREAGVSFGAAKRVLRRAKAGRVSSVEDTQGDEVTREESGDAAEVRVRTRTPIVTVEDAIRHARVDLTVWRVDRFKIVSGEVPMKLSERDGRGKITSERPHAEPVWWITLKLVRVMPKSERDALEGLIARLNAAPKCPQLRTLAPPTGSHLMVLDLVDLHFGKLAWAPETGQNYDLAIADRVYRDAVEDLLSRASGFPVDEFLVPLGSDFLHVDNSGGTTTAGTPQDVDGRLAKILEVAEAAVVWAVGAMAARGRVVVRWVPGNHDRTLSLFLARIIKAYFRGNLNVTVDCEPTCRKYHRYHSTLIGLTHGDEQKHASLPVVMAQECKDDWAGTTCREWHVGHFHKSRRLDTVPLDTHGGVPVRTLRSLSAVDAWHHRKGYVGTQRSAEAYLYNRSTGYVGHVVADVRQGV